MNPAAPDLLDDLIEVQPIERIPAAVAQLPPEVRRYVLPFAFAKRHGVLINGLLDGRPLTIVRSDAKLAAISEVRRFVDGAMRMRVVAPRRIRPAAAADLRARIEQHDADGGWPG